MRILCGLVVALILAAVALAQQGAGQALPKQIASKDQTREFTEIFLGRMVSARPYDAFLVLKSVAPDADNYIESTRQRAEELIDQVRPSYGKIIAFEHLDTKSLGQSFVRYDYLLKFEAHALHVRVIYYRARNTWSPVMLEFNPDLTDLFIDLAK